LRQCFDPEIPVNIVELDPFCSGRRPKGTLDCVIAKIFGEFFYSRIDKTHPNSKLGISETPQVEKF